MSTAVMAGLGETGNGSSRFGMSLRGRAGSACRLRAPLGAVRRGSARQSWCGITRRGTSSHVGAGQGASVLARRVLVGLRTARRGPSWQGSHGIARQARQGESWRGTACHGEAGRARPRSVGHRTAWRGTAR